MGQGYSLTAFAGHIGKCIDTMSEWRHSFPEFSSAVKRAQSARVNFLETALLAAKNPVPFIFALKNACPAEWRDIQRTEVTGKDGAAVQIEGLSHSEVHRELTLRGISLGEMAHPVPITHRCD